MGGTRGVRSAGRAPPSVGRSQAPRALAPPAAQTPPPCLGFWGKPGLSAPSGTGRDGPVLCHPSGPSPSGCLLPQTWPLHGPDVSAVTRDAGSTQGCGFCFARGGCFRDGHGRPFSETHLPREGGLVPCRGAVFHPGRRITAEWLCGRGRLPSTCHSPRERTREDVPMSRAVGEQNLSHPRTLRQPARPPGSRRGCARHSWGAHRLEAPQRAPCRLPSSPEPGLSAALSQTWGQGTGRPGAARLQPPPRRAGNATAV